MADLTHFTFAVKMSLFQISPVVFLYFKGSFFVTLCLMAVLRGFPERLWNLILGDTGGGPGLEVAWSSLLGQVLLSAGPERLAQRPPGNPSSMNYSVTLPVI